MKLGRQLSITSSLDLFKGLSESDWTFSLSWTGRTGLTCLLCWTGSRSCWTGARSCLLSVSLSLLFAAVFLL